MSSFNFKGRGVQYWRDQTEHIQDFSELVEFFERKHGVHRAKAILLAKVVSPEAYSENMRREFKTGRSTL